MYDLSHHEKTLSPLAAENPQIRDQVILIERMKRQIENTLDITSPTDLAPPTKRCMFRRRTDSAKNLLVSPSHYIQTDPLLLLANIH